MIIKTTSPFDIERLMLIKIKEINVSEGGPPQLEFALALVLFFSLVLIIGGKCASSCPFQLTKQQTQSSNNLIIFRYKVLSY